MKNSIGLKIIKYAIKVVAESLSKIQRSFVYYLVPVAITDHYYTLNVRSSYVEKC